MTEQPGTGPQPQILSPAPPPPMYVQPNRPAGTGALRGVLITLVVLGLLAGAVVGGFYALGSVFTVSDDSWIDEVHYSGNKLALHKIAIVSVDDVIMDSTARHAIRHLKAAADDDRVRAVVLKINSPGGTINASDHIHRKVKELARGPGETKPVVVSMQGLAASGGYYIAAPANRIFAERTTMTGSIGVIASFPNVAGLMDKFQVEMEVVKTGPMKDAGSPFREMTDEERQRWQTIINDAFDTFLEVVSEGRSMDRAKLSELATGDVFTAREAKANGLVDEIGYLEDAIEAAKNLAGVDDVHVVEYKRPLDLSEILFGGSVRRSLQVDLSSIYEAAIPRVMYLTQAPSF